MKEEDDARNKAVREYVHLYRMDHDIPDNAVVEEIQTIFLRGWDAKAELCTKAPQSCSAFKIALREIEAFHGKVTRRLKCTIQDLQHEIKRLREKVKE